MQILLEISILVYVFFPSFGRFRETYNRIVAKRLKGQDTKGYKREVKFLEDKKIKRGNNRYKCIRYLNTPDSEVTTIYFPCPGLGF